MFRKAITALNIVSSETSLSNNVLYNGSHYNSDGVCQMSDTRRQSEDRSAGRGLSVDNDQCFATVRQI